MTTPSRYSAEPFELTLDPWLLEGTPTPGCSHCAALVTKRDQAAKARDWKTACNAARGIRNHRNGHRETLPRLRPRDRHMRLPPRRRKPGQSSSRGG